MFNVHIGSPCDYTIKSIVKTRKIFGKLKIVSNLFDVLFKIRNIRSEIFNILYVYDISIDRSSSNRLYLRSESHQTWVKTHPASSVQKLNIYFKIVELDWNFNSSISDENDLILNFSESDDKASCFIELIFHSITNFFNDVLIQIMKDV